MNWYLVNINFFVGNPTIFKHFCNFWQNFEGHQAQPDGQNLMILGVLVVGPMPFDLGGILWYDC